MAHDDIFMFQLTSQIFAFLRQLEESHSSSFAQSIESEDFARAIAHIDHTILSLKGDTVKFIFLLLSYGNLSALGQFFNREPDC